MSFKVEKPQRRSSMDEPICPYCRAGVANIRPEDEGNNTCEECGRVFLAEAEKYIIWNTVPLMKCPVCEKFVSTGEDGVIPLYHHDSKMRLCRGNGKKGIAQIRTVQEEV